MPRPVRCRRVCVSPTCTYFKPAGIPVSQLQESVVAVDELEALRLADVEGSYHEQAAEQMGISRRTFSRILESARRKVALALLQGMALRIEGGVVSTVEQRTFRCGRCGHAWQEPFGTGRPAECPACRSQDFHRADDGRASGGRRSAGDSGDCCAENVVQPAGQGGPAAAATGEIGRGRQRRSRGRGI